MSKINIQGTIDNIRSRSNVYTPIIEAVVNAIDSIILAERPDGKIHIKLKRQNVLPIETFIGDVHSIEIHDNGIGFNQKNRDSFDTLYSLFKRSTGGKGFGRFMFLKYFTEVKINSTFKSDGSFKKRIFSFGKEDEIIVDEKIEDTNQNDTNTIVYLNNLTEGKYFDKELETIARKLLEKLLIFFIDDSFTCPEIIIEEADNTKRIVLNDYLKADQEIKLLKNDTFELYDSIHERYELFTIKVFKIYFSKSESKIILTADKREVTDTSIHLFIPEFEDDFFDERKEGEKMVKKNYIVKTYVLAQFLNKNVGLERESFNFPKDKADAFFSIYQRQIEESAALKSQEIFSEDVKVRSEKKRQRIHAYVNKEAPWHKSYLSQVDLTKFGYNLSDEQIESELQKFKFEKEQQTKKEVSFLLASEGENEFEMRFTNLISSITEIGKSDLAHYVCNRKVVLQAFEELRKRDEEGKAKLEKEIHSLIFPMNRDSTNTSYEEHNLWLLDERLVFSEYIASDRKISHKREALDEPDLLIFDVKRTYRNGDNEFSNPLTIFEFKKPKRTSYTQEDDPIRQVGNYLAKIRSGKYEMPEGTESIKVNSNTPVYAYVICDIVPKVQEFALMHQLTISPDEEGYFGFHRGYNMYVEIISYKKLSKDSMLRNRIFFKKLQLE